MKTSICAISTGPTTHLDHLAPLCEALQIPLIVTEPDHEKLAQIFYPMIEIQYRPLRDLHLDFLAKWEGILTCGKFWAMELRPLLRLIKGVDVRLIFAPHGHSDKEEFLDEPIHQDIDLVYGPRMKKARKNPKAIEMGNIRRAFYQKYKGHFDTLASPFFQTKKQNVLYAPTWESRATPTSFFEQIEKIVSLLAGKYHLLIKLHPLLEENNPALYHANIGQYESKATFIENFPAIYPLLEKTDIYLGDHSSIGYDFLCYDRPMFFLSEKGALMECGRKFTGSVNKHQRELSSIRKKHLEEVFGAPTLDEKELTRKIRMKFLVAET